MAKPRIRSKTMHEIPGDDDRPLYLIAFFASVAMLAIIPAQVAAFALVPMPSSVEGWFDLFNGRFLGGLFHADFFILVNNALIAVIYLALYRLLREVNRSLAQLAVVLGWIGIAAYLSSNRTFELAALAREWAGAGDGATRAMLLGAGRAALAAWQGTAFDAYYVLNGVALLVIALLMFRSPRFSRATAGFGLAAAVLMSVPSTAGTLGLVFSLLSLLPWYVFTVMFARVFLREARGRGLPEAGGARGATRP